MRRDLHDELAPTLAALGLDAATVGELIPTDSKEAALANEKLRSAIRATVGDVRRLVYDLRPPALDELGLVEAMRQRASRLGVGDEGFLATVEAPDELPPLPAAVEVAAYRIVQEALTNVSRHARASACTVRLACADGRALAIEVTDDGVGLPDTPEAELASPRCASAPLSSGESARSCAHCHPAHGSSPGYRLGSRCPKDEGRVGALEKLRVLIADDHPLFRDGMRGLLSTQPDIEVAGEATTGEEAVKLSGELEPDVVLMDVKMPGLGGIEATRRVLAANRVSASSSSPCSRTMPRSSPPCARGREDTS